MKKCFFIFFLSLSTISVSTLSANIVLQSRTDGNSGILQNIYNQLGITLTASDFICIAPGQYTFQTAAVSGTMSIEALAAYSIVTVSSSAGNCSFIVEDNIDAF
jgi:hypothetical protein